MTKPKRIDWFSDAFSRLEDTFKDTLKEQSSVLEDALGAFSEPFHKPNCLVVEQPEQLIIELDLPGVRREDITISVSNGAIKVTGQRREEKREGRYIESQHYMRSPRGDFRWMYDLQRAFSDPEHIEATLQAGVLTLIVRRTTPRKVEIKVDIK